MRCLWKMLDSCERTTTFDTALLLVHKWIQLDIQAVVSGTAPTFVVHGRVHKIIDELCIERHILKRAEQRGTFVTRRNEKERVSE